MASVVGCAADCVTESTASFAGLRECPANRAFGACPTKRFRLQLPLVTMPKVKILHREHRHVRRSAIVAGCPSANVSSVGIVQLSLLTHHGTLVHKRPRATTVPPRLRQVCLQRSSTVE